MIRTRQKYYLLSTVSAVVLAFFFCKDQVSVTEDTLAVVGDRRIGMEEFAERYRDFRRRTGEGVHDTFEARRQVLNLQVEEEILISEAKRRGLHKDRIARHERQRIEMQELLNAFNRNLIASEVQLSEEELKHLFIKLNTKIKAQHLYAETREKADSLLLAVQQGATFEQLAEKVFQDPKLRHSGGSLGYFTIDEMEPNFEDAAFALSVGEISRPIRTSDGYSIIMVEDRITQPLLTEFDFAKHRHKLYGYWKKRKIKRAAQSYVDSLTRSLNISFNGRVVEELFAAVQSTPKNSNPSENRPSSLNFSRVENRQLVRSDLGAWDVAAFQERATFTSKGQHNWIRSPEHLKEFVSGLIARDAILEKAREANLHNTPEYSKNVTNKWDNYLLNRIEREMRENRVVSEDSLRRYFDEDPERFAAPPEINLREIVVREKVLAMELIRKLDQGASFEELARTHSIRDWSAERGGELGFLTAREFGDLAPDVFELGVGERAGPIAMDSTYMVLECIEKKPPKIRSFEQVRSEVEKTVRYLSWNPYRSSQISQFRKSLDHFKVLPQRLKEIRLIEVDRSKS